MRRICAAGAAALVLTGCGSGLAAATSTQKTSARRATPPPTTCLRRSGFALSLAGDRGGQATPVAAATWLAAHGGINGIPRRGWTLTGENRDGATVASRRTVLHAVRGSDGTWRVDSGYTCR